MGNGNGSSLTRQGSKGLPGVQGHKYQVSLDIVLNIVEEAAEYGSYYGGDILAYSKDAHK